MPIELQECQCYWKKECQYTPTPYYNSISPFPNSGPTKLGSNQNMIKPELNTVADLSCSTVCFGNPDYYTKFTSMSVYNFVNKNTNSYNWFICQHLTLIMNNEFLTVFLFQELTENYGRHNCGAEGRQSKS